MKINSSLNHIRQEEKIIKNIPPSPVIERERKLNINKALYLFMLYAIIFLLIYRLLVKFSKDPFSINCMNFLTLIIHFLNINLGFAQNILLWPHSSRCAMHGMRIWIMVN